MSSSWSLRLQALLGTIRVTVLVVVLVTLVVVIIKVVIPPCQMVSVVVTGGFFTAWLTAPRAQLPGAHVVRIFCEEKLYCLLSVGRIREELAAHPRPCVASLEAQIHLSVRHPDANATIGLRDQAERNNKSAYRASYTPLSQSFT